MKKGLLQIAFLASALALFLSAYTNSEPILERAKKLEDATDYAGACRIYAEGLKTDPDNPVYLWRQAFDSYEAGNIDDALVYCEKRLKKNPEDPHALLLKASCYDFLRFQKLPERLFEKALAAPPSAKTLEEMLLIACAYRSTRDQKNEEKIFNSILEKCKFPRNAGEYNIKGTALYELDRFDEARDTLIEGLQKYPKAANLYLKLGAIYFWQANDKKCREYINKAIELQGDVLLTRSIIGSADFYDGKYEQSIQYFDKALKQQPKYLSLRYLKIEACAHLKKMDQAKKEMETILSIEPDNTWATKYMSTAYDIAGNKKDAIKILKSKLKSMPQDPVLSVALADTYQ